MDGDARNQLEKALRRLLRPLVRIMLRQGISFGEFAEITKRTYMEIAWDEFTPSGARPSDSRVAIMTGLTRKEVKRLRESRADGEELSTSQMNRATRVLSGWYRDPDFCDDRGEPRVLSMADTTSGFPALVRRYSGDMPPRAMLEELGRVKAVDASDPDNIRVLSRSFVPDGGDADGLRMLGLSLSDLGNTIDSNLNAEAGDTLAFQRYVANARVNPRMVPLFKRLLNERGAQLLESLDDWLSAQEIEAEADVEPAHIGAGLYFFDRTRNDENKH